MEEIDLKKVLEEIDLKKVLEEIKSLLLSKHLDNYKTADRFVRVSLTEAVKRSDDQFISDLYAFVAKYSDYNSHRSLRNIYTLKKSTAKNRGLILN